MIKLRAHVKKKLIVLITLIILSYLMLYHDRPNGEFNLSDYTEVHLAIERQARGKPILIKPNANMNRKIKRRLNLKLLPILINVTKEKETVVKKPKSNSIKKHERKDCPLNLINNLNVDIQTLELYKELKFNQLGDGLQKQDFNLSADIDWKKQPKLKVFVVPFSHNDPGWLRTIGEYFTDETKHIFINMVAKLGEHPARKFIWPEVSFLELFWKNAPETSKEAIRQLGQLEIVTGGWVMNDEANTHWDSILQQLTTGHQWLIKHLNYTPRSAWTIDTYGSSPTMAKLFEGADLKNLAIQRVHYAIKKYLAARRQLEFRWKQLWDVTEERSVFTHMMPFSGTDVTSSCGPDPKICRRFDFHLSKVATIKKDNIEYLAKLLLDQYRKKAQLYLTNVLLVPLGGNNRYVYTTEWNRQYRNYEKLFEYMNRNKTLNVEVKFGTLTDFFNTIKNEKVEFPTLSGDFFPYADKGDHYWSGFYSSRPLLKRMERILLHYVKASDIIVTIMKHFKDKKQSIGTSIKLARVIEEARRSLALIQHHDAITGTAKDHVVRDYYKRVFKAIKNCEYVIQHAVKVTLASEHPTDKDTIFYNFDEVVRDTRYGLPQTQRLITINNVSRWQQIVLYNSLSYMRNEVVRFLISTPNIKVSEEVAFFTDKYIEYQISPIFESGADISQSMYELSFNASSISPFSVVSYSIAWRDMDLERSVLIRKHPSNVEDFSNQTYASIKIYNYNGEVKTPLGFDKIDVEKAKEFSIQNDRITATFTSLGLLKEISFGEDSVPIHLDFAQYRSHRSGAYLFLPDDDAKPIHINSTLVKVIKGPIYSSVIVQLPNILHTVTLYNSIGADGLGIQIVNLVDISDTNNNEIVMRLSTTIKSGSEFFTDLNGHQILRRKRFPKLPLQGNYYPMPTTAYIEDDDYRLTVLTAVPLGCTSLKEGQLEIMLDRRLNQDDNRGLAQGIQDNCPTKHIFNLVLEKRKENCQVVAENHPSGFHTISSHVSSQSLLNPLIKLIRTDRWNFTEPSSWFITTTNIGVDISISSLRSGVVVQNSEDNIGLVVNRHQLDTCFEDGHLLDEFYFTNGTIKIKEILPFVKYARESTLTFLSLGDAVNISEPQFICPMSSQAFVMKIKEDFNN